MLDPHPCSPSKRHQAGFSLIEVMAAMVVMTIGMLGLVSMLNMAAHQDGAGRRKDRATMIAYDLLHHLERLPFDAEQLKDASTSNDNDLLAAGTAFNGMDTTTISNTAYDQDDGVLYDPAAGNTSNDPGADLRFDGFKPAANAVLGEGGRPTLDFNGDGKDDFQRRWVIRNLDPNPGEGAPPGKQITVIVTWRDPTLGLRRRVAVVGFKANFQLLLPQ